MIFAFIDTNIWIRVLSQGRPGCEVSYLEELGTLVDQGRVTLLLPEVVELELEKNWRKFTDTVTVEFAKLEEKIGSAFKPKPWSEIEDIQGSVVTLLKDAKEKKIEAAQQTHQRIQQLFSHPKVVKIPFTSELAFLGRRRLIAGRMPDFTNQAHSDACNVEAVAGHLKTVTSPDLQLYFCSENTKDFALKTDEGLTLHPLVKEGLPPTKLTITLRELVDFHRSQAKVTEPAKEKVEAARERQLVAASPSTEEVLASISSDATQEQIQQLENVLKTLTYREREIIKLRFGLGDGYTYTLKECARIFQRSPSRIAQIQAKALKKLKHPVRSRLLEQALEKSMGSHEGTKAGPDASSKTSADASPAAAPGGDGDMSGSDPPAV